MPCGCWARGHSTQWSGERGPHQTQASFLSRCNNICQAAEPRKQRDSEFTLPALFQSKAPPAPALPIIQMTPVKQKHPKIPAGLASCIPNKSGLIWPAWQRTTVSILKKGGQGGGRRDKQQNPVCFSEALQETTLLGVELLQHYNIAVIVTSTD